MCQIKQQSQGIEPGDKGNKTLLNKYNILDDLFSDSEISSILNEVKNSDNKIVLENSGRVLIPFKIDENIQIKLEKIATDLYGKKLNLSDFAYAEFSLKYGNPELKPHLDKNSTEFIIDYQVGGNVEWSVYIEENRLILKDNQAVAFSGIDNVHWRPDKKFKDGEYLNMIYFHFVGDDYVHDEKNITNQYQIEEKYEKLYLNSY